MGRPTRRGGDPTGASGSGGRRPKGVWEGHQHEASASSQVPAQCERGCARVGGREKRRGGWAMLLCGKAASGRYRARPSRRAAAGQGQRRRAAPPRLTSAQCDSIVMPMDTLPGRASCLNPADL